MKKFLGFILILSLIFLAIPTPILADAKIETTTTLSYSTSNSIVTLTARTAIAGTNDPVTEGKLQIQTPFGTWSEDPTDGVLTVTIDNAQLTGDFMAHYTPAPQSPFAQSHSSISFEPIDTDTTAPVITVPDNIVAEATGPAGAMVTFSVTATDNKDGVVTVTCTPLSGSIFPLGTTTVSCSAKDSNNNTATGSFTVTVVDTTPPSIIASPTLTVIVGAPKSVLTATASDIVDQNPSLDNDAPAFFPVGKTVVTWTATDYSGNKSTATTEVTATYKFGGFLPPLGPGPSAFKAGSTIPVKFQLTDYNGKFVSTATGSVVTSPAMAAKEAIRYDATAQQYIANLKTVKTATPGDYMITVNLNDGTSPSIKVILK